MKSFHSYFSRQHPETLGTGTRTRTSGYKRSETDPKSISDSQRLQPSPSGLSLCWNICRVLCDKLFDQQPTISSRRLHSQDQTPENLFLSIQHWSSLVEMTITAWRCMSPPLASPVSCQTCLWAMTHTLVILWSSTRLGWWFVGAQLFMILVSFFKMEPGLKQLHSKRTGNLNSNVKFNDSVL